MKKPIISFIIIVVCMNLGVAQTTPATIEKKVPVLYNHSFPSMGQFRSSFINTSLSANLGFGLTSLIQIPGIEIGDYNILAFEGQILFFNMNVQYQQRFNPWLALFISGEMAGRIGTDMSTIMADGVNTLQGGKIGWLVKIRQVKRFNLSGSIYVQNLTGNIINVSEYFKDLINNVPNPAVVKRSPALNIGLGIQGAYAFNPTFGLQFQSDLTYGESFERTKSKAYFSGGIIGDVDFLPKQNIPINLALGYTLTSTPAIVMSEGGFSSLFSGKIGYSGSDEFELGAQFTYYNVELKSVDDKPSIVTMMLLLKFYF
jgi:hypothetical protein